jgi:CBS domain containing-hemolysin-like protein
MILLIVFAFIAIGVSFICSVLEAALLSVTPSYIAQLKDERPRLHDRLAQLKEKIDSPLAAILTLNTIAHTVGATGVGAQVTVVFGDTWLGLASAVMTLLILVVSEIIPKTIGATYWRQLSPMLPPVLNALVWILMPFIWLSELITRRIGEGGAEVDMRAEIKALARIGREQEALDADEARVIANILNLHEIRVREVMTPRNVAVVVPPGLTVADFQEQYAPSAFTRFPVMTADDQARGYIHKADVLQAGADVALDSLMHPPTLVGVEDDLDQVFSTMIHGRTHMCVVYDDLGIWQGLITMEDIIEAILGQDIVDETDDVANLRRFARQRWTRRLKKLREKQ